MLNTTMIGKFVKWEKSKCLGGKINQIELQGKMEENI